MPIGWAFNPQAGLCHHWICHMMPCSPWSQNLCDFCLFEWKLQKEFNCHFAQLSWHVALSLSYWWMFFFVESKCIKQSMRFVRPRQGAAKYTNVLMLSRRYFVRSWPGSLLCQFCSGRNIRNYLEALLPTTSHWLTKLTSALHYFIMAMNTPTWSHMFKRYVQFICIYTVYKYTSILGLSVAIGPLTLHNYTICSKLHCWRSDTFRFFHTFRKRPNKRPCLKGWSSA